MKIPKKTQIILIMAVSVLLALVVLLKETVFDEFVPVVTRNANGEGKRMEEYEVSIEDTKGKQSIQLEVSEKEYTHEEIQDMFHEIPKELDEVVLGANESFDRVEQDLNLVTQLPEYPVEIYWELSSYDVFSLEGKILQEDLNEEGTLVEIKGIVSCQQEQMIYGRTVMVYPPTREGMEGLLYEIKKELRQRESDTRQEDSFPLPEKVAGKELKWGRKTENQWCYILIFGGAVCAFIVYRERETKKQKEVQRKEALLREYPGMISKFTMLLSTGTTVKNAWEKMVFNYEQQKEQTGEKPLYEEMKSTLYEMQSGISEAESYERFGKRCALTTYVKFGTLLTQNLRKGSQGLSQILRMEALQSFENRKSRARQLGEEAGAKLLMPMMGMLVVVLIMIMVPAFLTMRL